MIAPAARADPPPFDGTAWISAAVLTPQSPSDVMSVAFAGVARRTAYDRRANGWVTHNSYVFRGTFRESRPIDFVVNPEFESQEAAAAQAGRFARVVQPGWLFCACLDLLEASPRCLESGVGVGPTPSRRREEF